MPKRLYPVLVETYQGRSPAGLSAPATAKPVEVALACRQPPVNDRAGLSGSSRLGSRRRRVHRREWRGPRCPPPWAEKAGIGNQDRGVSTHKWVRAKSLSAVVADH